MSTVMVITPILIANWPAITAAVTAAVGAMGFASLQDAESQLAAGASTNREEIEVEDSEILQGTAGMNESIVVMRDGIRARSVAMHAAPCDSAWRVEDYQNRNSANWETS